jgi:predicted CXXCH cytochrome family protein
MANQLVAEVGLASRQLVLSIVCEIGHWAREILAGTDAAEIVARSRSSGDSWLASRLDFKIRIRRARSYDSMAGNSHESGRKLRIATLRELGESPPVARSDSQAAARTLFVALLALFLLGGCGDSGESPNRLDPSPVEAVEIASEPASARFVGSSACLRCHPAESAGWRGSHHDRAMEIVSDDSVLGRFDGSVLKHGPQSWRFLRFEDEFVVELEESERPTERLRVSHTFGFSPLQQYLVERPDGRRQALPVAWDSRPQQDGGQRWIDLQPQGPVSPDDPLHWDGLAYNWNSQCAVCHSTQLVKGYDPETNRFETRSAQIDVGCEACHGPGSWHVELAADPGALQKGPSGFAVTFERYSEELWRRAPGERIATRSIQRKQDPQVDVCSPCHARRTQLVSSSEIGEPFLDGHRPRLLDPDLYFEDGQIRDEVYVWGSFLQSPMYAAGVRCSDCHDPHSLRLRRSENELCMGCHDREAFDVKRHHGHESNSLGARCVACHMPERVYMEVDARRDHSFPIPRPRRSAIFESPDVCAGCHADRDADWAADQIASWRDPDTIARPHWSDHLVRDSAARIDSERWLEMAVDTRLPSIARANAWSRLAREEGAQPAPELLRERIREGSDLERLALVEIAQRTAPSTRASLLRPLLEDELRSIRIAAAIALSDLPASIWRPADRSVLAGALEEYRAAQHVNAERPESQVNLGVLAVRYGELDAARAAYQRALELAPYFVPAYANLADLERALGRDAEAIVWLRRALEWAPDEPLVRYALGLALHRVGQSEESLEQLARAARLAPDQARVVLGWALALDAAGRRDEAVAVLTRAMDGGVIDPELFHALATLERDAGHGVLARKVARAWSEAWPDDERARALLRELDGRR